MQRSLSGWKEPALARARLRVAGTALLLAVVALWGIPAGAHAARSDAKAIWGPLTVGGKSAFPAYHHMGVGIYQMGLLWNDAAPTRPANAQNPNDPAYHWPAGVSYAIQQAARYHMQVLLLVEDTPGWANGGQDPSFPPTNVADFANFMTAAARRYPTVHLWMVWGEPTRQPQFGVVVPVDPSATTLTPEQAVAPHIYAQMLDASYGALKAVSRQNLVIGGDTFTTGDIDTAQWIENMRLPNGQPPRMDLYGHNPFSFRPPNLANPPSPDGQVDFSDLARLSQLVNSNLAAPGQTIKLFLSEWTIPTAAGDDEFNFFVPPDVQAQWITDAWTIVRQSPFIYALGWTHVYDDPPGSNGSSGGLFNYLGQPKPGYYAFRAG
jgi:hypothetical protein